MAVNKQQVRAFVERWDGQGYEKGDTHKFWLELLAAIGYQHATEVKFEHRLPNGGFVDVWLRDASVLVEQKGMNVDLNKAELRQGELKTPLVQALDYVDNMPRVEQPRYVVTCNFGTFRVHDRDKHAKADLAANAFEFSLRELAEHPEYLAFILDPDNSRLEKEKQVSIQAGALIGRLYDQMRQGYLDADSPETMHALNVLCVRLVFCLFCEDADLFPKDAFHQFLRDVPPAHVRTQLKRLFAALNTDIPDRDQYDLDLKPFPYVNGGLFREDTEIPNFTPEMKDFLLEQVSGPVDWSKISPTIFGGIFESTLNPVTRRAGGMHYTSPRNIHRVIDPLFMDELYAEFNAIRTEEGQTPRAKKNRLKRFHKKLCGLTFFDPACGSGNFLTETYLCLRALEDEILHELMDGQAGFTFADEALDGDRVSLNQFYGIEINDFAVTVAETALWISRLKANGDSEMLYDIASKDFPLVERPNILHANALRVDWNDVLPAERCDYVMGNPPFAGARLMTKEQKQDVTDTWGPRSGNLDYVTCWFKKASDYLGAVDAAKFAFVSTNSIVQGEPVATMFDPIMGAGWKISFAHQSFPWTTESAGAAAVHCVIVGFSRQRATAPRLFTYGVGNNEAVEISATNINAYLMDSASVNVQSRTKPVSTALPAVSFGSMANPTAPFVVSVDDLDEVRSDAIASKYLHRFVGSEELIHSKERWCYWLDTEAFEPADITASRHLQALTNAVREKRLSSKRAATAALAEIPHLFAERRQPELSYVCIPKVASENRAYFTADYLGPEVIASDLVFTCPDEDGFVFAIVSSSMFITWQKTVGGRLESRLRFSNTVVWNNLPLPPVAPELRAQIIAAGKAVLAARALHPERSLAKHYEPGKLSPELQAAHDALDLLVDKAFGAQHPLADNTERLQVLFARYSELTAAPA